MHLLQIHPGTDFRRSEGTLLWTPLYRICPTEGRPGGTFIFFPGKARLEVLCLFFCTLEGRRRRSIQYVCLMHRKVILRGGFSHERLRGSLVEHQLIRGSLDLAYQSRRSACELAEISTAAPFCLISPRLRAPQLQNVI